MQRRHRPRWDVLLAIAAGGALGSLARYGLTVAFPHPRGGFATSTLLANLIGCLLVGGLMVTVTDLAQPHRLLRPFLGIGLLGGFTTFSTYVLDATDSALTGHPGLALLYAVVSVLGSLALVVTGMSGTRALRKLVTVRPRQSG
ncbi:fluoride efflux transporter FluC [Amycolatopsis cihanbeyliensis]|uniref:Fluoride-specific ion channel FluC n=1 Tax=Amycolatopsis cihanbeyliensis TaxID=1128664 RepID=A0A542DD55_AMYCI|nr:CrcB family protein [Amycolatopsis cihanbeyliensis]TQJ01001.1 CrcB protein [Amycolatopsis cihanbeyliensis]